ncbi:MAG: Gldg family protein [Gemmataceae bacterium]
MSNAPQQPTPPVSPLMRALLNNRKQLRGLIFFVAAAFAAYLIYEVARAGGIGGGIRLRWIYLAVMSLVTLAVGTIDLIGDEVDEGNQVARLRLELMTLGGVLGLATALLGFILPFTTYREQLAAGLDSWRANPQALIYPGLAVVGGLGLMFLSVQLVRGMERQSQGIRRIVYGYNVVLTTILLLAVLALPNVLAYAEPFTRFFGRPFDWTATDINSISPLMRNYLADLKQPVKAYLLMRRDDQISMDMQTLLDNCKSLNSRFSWELVSPRSIENQSRIAGMMEKYNISDPQGVLLVVGEESEKSKPDFAFVKARDLFEQDFRGGRGAPLSYAFLGENALYNALASLTEGKVVIYFTTGHGELTPEGGMPPGMPRNMPRPRAGGLAKLRDKLTERKSVEVKTLPVDRSLKKVPDDASVVVVARPTTAFNPEEVKVLREYVQRTAKVEKAKDASGRERDEEKVTAGKLMFLLEPVIQKEGGNATMAPTGLDSLLAEYGVRVNNDRVISVNRQVRNPLQVLAIPDPESANPVAKAFTPSPTSVTLFLLDNARTVEALDAKGGGRSVDKLLIAPAQFDIVIDKRLTADPVELANALRADEDRLEKEAAKASPTVAVAVSDGGTPPGMPRDAAHSAELKDTPRMVVFGSAQWVTDEGLEGGRGTLRADLFNSCVSWLRGTSSVGAKIEAKKRKEYDLNIAPQDTGKVMYLPLGLLLLGVVGLGTGVWVVRRR